MMDKSFLRSFGWSEELIRAAEYVSSTVSVGAVIGSSSLGIDVKTTHTVATSSGSQGTDVSGPPIAQSQLFVISGN